MDENDDEESLMDSDDKRIVDMELRQISIDEQTSSDHRPETNTPT